MLKDEVRNNLLSIKQLIQKLGMSRSTIYALIKRNDFPQPIKIGRLARWIESEIDDYIITKKTLRNQNQDPATQEN